MKRVAVALVLVVVFLLSGCTISQSPPSVSAGEVCAAAGYVGEEFRDCTLLALERQKVIAAEELARENDKRDAERRRAIMFQGRLY